MSGDIAFPVYVVAKDCGEITVFSELAKMQWHFEPMDVENHEYEAWDADGHHLELTVGKPKSEWLKISQLDRTLSQGEFAELKAKALPYRDPEPLLRMIGRKLGLLRADS